LKQNIRHKSDHTAFFFSSLVCFPVTKRFPVLFPALDRSVEKEVDHKPKRMAVASGKREGNSGREMSKDVLKCLHVFKDQVEIVELL